MTRPTDDRSLPLTQLLEQARACRLCEAVLPKGPNPVVRASNTARLLIIGQAPGTKVHETGIPWNDASGERLRDWMALDSQVFYDETRIAIMPMGFCYPGRNPAGGDAPPRQECAPTWHPSFIARMPQVDLTLLIGLYAQRAYLGSQHVKSVRETVARYEDHVKRGFFPLPHPSWRTRAWQRKNPWFTSTVIPALRKEIAERV